jgi:ABC-type nitrate/sulfonate/bicarbonate transport system ATPase subunit
MKPIDWIYQEHHNPLEESSKLEQRLRKTAEVLQSLSFLQAKQQQMVAVEDGTVLADADTEEVDDGVEAVMRELKEEKEDWFGDLSGGQKSKVELVRKVFLHERCPNVVLIDETFAPLDPASKVLVMSKLKEFCKGSIILVIYHADIGHGQETEEGETVECVPSSDFFDHNIHLENQVIKLRPVC